MGRELADRLKASGIRPAVVCGGAGAEREVSLQSGRVAHKALLEGGFDAELLVLPAEGTAEALERSGIRLAVLMLHGEFGEDGGAQTVLGRMGVPYTGSDARASSLAMDKDACKRLFAAAGVPTPRWITAYDPDMAADLVKRAGLRFPLFVKPNFRGSSVGASRAENPRELRDAFAKALGEDVLAIAEELVAGRELTVGWLDGNALPIIEMVAEGGFYDYHAKYLSNATRYICPAELDGGTTKRVEKHALAAAKIVGVRDMSRIDVMLGADGPMVLEVNTLPGFTSHSLLPQAAAKAGIGLSELCARFVEKAAKRGGIV